MAFVALVKEETASAELKQRYQAIRKEFGFLPNVFPAMGDDVRLIDGQGLLFDSIMSDGALPRAVKEQIGVVVSGLNTSSYCVALHMEMLRRLGIEKPLSRKLSTDWANAAVDDKVKALFRFADKLTRKPEDVEQSDVDALRAAGWNDAAVRETVLTTALFNLVNRVSLGLGVVADF